MSMTCATLIERAKSFSPLNASLASDPAELLTRIHQIQTRVFAAIAEVSKDRFQVSATLSSSTGASARTLTLTDLTVPLERLLTLTVPNGEARLVDPQDLDAEYAPRFLARGQTLVEVGTDWSATNGALICTLVYVRAATPITTTDGISQTISIPDDWADLLIKPLAAYLHLKDPGRDPSEYERLQAEYQADWDAVVATLTHTAGRITQGALLPAPATIEKR